MAFKKGNKPKGGKKFTKNYQPPKENVGAPKSVIDEKKFEEMAANDFTMEECAAEMGVCVDTLYARFSEPLKKGRLRGNGSIKRQLFKKAMNGDTAMLIWLGKVRLKYKEPEKEEQSEKHIHVTVNELPK